MRAKEEDPWGKLGLQQQRTRLKAAHSNDTSLASLVCWRPETSVALAWPKLLLAMLAAAIGLVLYCCPPLPCPDNLFESAQHWRLHRAEHHCHGLQGLDCGSLKPMTGEQKQEMFKEIQTWDVPLLAIVQ